MTGGSGPAGLWVGRLGPAARTGPSPSASLDLRPVHRPRWFGRFLGRLPKPTAGTSGLDRTKAAFLHCCGATSTTWPDWLGGRPRRRGTPARARSAAGRTSDGVGLGALPRSAGAWRPASNHTLPLCCRRRRTTLTVSPSSRLGWSSVPGPARGPNVHQVKSAAACSGGPKVHIGRSALCLEEGRWRSFTACAIPPGDGSGSDGRARQLRSTDQGQRKPWTAPTGRFSPAWYTGALRGATRVTRRPRRRALSEETPGSRSTQSTPPWRACWAASSRAIAPPKEVAHHVGAIHFRGGRRSPDGVTPAQCTATLGRPPRVDREGAILHPVPRPAVGSGCAGSAGALVPSPAAAAASAMC
jgi:hypothetical protein